MGKVVDINGVTIDFGDLPDDEIQSYLSEQQDEIERARAKILASEIADALPEPPEAKDYSDDFASLGTIMLAIREELRKEGKDYSDAFESVVSAVTNIKLPEPQEIDFTPLIDKIGEIDVSMDTSAVESELKKIARLIAEQQERESRIVVETPATEKDPMITGLKVSERDRRTGDIVAVEFLRDG